MMIRTEEQRRILRQKILAARDELPPEQRREKSAAIRAALLGLEPLRRPETLLVYVNFRSEVETMGLIEELLAANKRVVVPRTKVAGRRLELFLLRDPKLDLRPGYQGIPEPNPARCPTVAGGKIEAVIVPGSVFDRRGGRLGYGGGYYDRFLANAAPQALRIGIAFDLQVVERLPLLPHDQPLHWLITESTVYDFIAPTRR